MAGSVIIPAYRAAATIAETVRAARRITGVSEVIVVDDGSGDDTGEEAAGAGADQVIAFPRNRGKGAALSAGVAAAKGEQLLFLDADLGASAAQAGALLDGLAGMGTPGMTVAVLPALPGRAGLGIAMRLARVTLKLLAGLDSAAPMSGQRALTSSLVKHIGLAPRWGVEVGLTVEAAHVGAAIREIPVPLEHARTGRDFAGFIHRARQLKDIGRFLVLVGHGLWWPALTRPKAMLRVLITAMTLAMLVVLGVLSEPPAAALIGGSALAAIVIWLPVLWLASVTLHLRKPNYLGRWLPSGAGLLFLIIGLPAFALTRVEPSERWAGLLAVGAFGILGLLDDVFAAGHQARGLRGHFCALLQGRVTTGAIKAIGGIATGIAIGALLDGGRPWLVAVDALLIALSANAVNLLDLRPGRALKGFALLAAISVATSPDSFPLLGPLTAAAIVSAPSDLAGRSMMGDVGANSLGAAAGFAMVTALSPWARVAVIVTLVAFHLLCERWSLTDIIAGNHVLHFVDSLGTTHLAPLATGGGSIGQQG